MKRIVIIGAGIAGLSAAYSLIEHGACQAGIEIIALEKNPLVGGNIRTERHDGYLIEGGPDCFLSEKPWAMELCRRIGLEDRLLPTNETNRKTFVLSNGRLHELPEGVILMVPTRILPFILSSLISMPGKIRMGMELFIPRGLGLGDESLAAFVRRRLGNEALDKIAEPLVAGVHAADPETMSVKSSFPKFVQMEQEHGSLIRGMIKRMGQMRRATTGAQGPRITMFMTLKDGLGSLVSTLKDRLTASGIVSIKTSVQAKAVVEKDKGYEIHIDGAPSIEADAVIIASPAYAAANLLDALDKPLATLLREIPYASTATISLGFKKTDINPRHPMNGFGFVVPRAEGRRIMAASWTSIKFAHRAPDDGVLIRCFIGGAQNIGLLDLSDAEMEKVVLEELKSIMGIGAAPVMCRIFRWPESMPQYTIGHQERVERIEELCSARPGLFLTGNAYHGIGISDSVRRSEIVAKKALHYLAGLQ
ncbi:MAG: protoporphyrinogen oxidase [Deltaproteobacteria bacterium]|nr:protoporphyrinogen oxidase [Deltaproteobacteria bacterium]